MKNENSIYEDKEMVLNSGNLLFGEINTFPKESQSINYDDNLE